MDANNKIGIIILAAGASTRLGKPKQLIKFRGQTLLSKTIETALQTNSPDIFVVLGADAEKITAEIKDFPVQISINKDWQSGMASSIRLGLKNLLRKNPDLSAVIILLCDQPLIESKHINLLISKFKQTGKPIIASEYKRAIGVPALFSSEMFDRLRLIKGDQGARKIIRDFSELVETVDIPEALFDIDTAEDLGKLVSFEQK